MNEIPKFHTLIVHYSDSSIATTLQKFYNFVQAQGKKPPANKIEDHLKIIEEKPYKFITKTERPTARELLAEIPKQREGVATLVVYEGKMYSDKKENFGTGTFIPKLGYAIEGLAEKQNRRAIVSGKGLGLRHTAVHEVGHLFGLDHCKNKCIMASGFDRKNGGYIFEWCNDCESKLLKNVNCK